MFQETQAFETNVGERSARPWYARRPALGLVVLAVFVASLVAAEAPAEASEPLIFARDQVLWYGESCPAGTTDLRRPTDHYFGLAICRPDGFVPIAGPTGSEELCNLARESGIGGWWYQGDPVSVCTYGYSWPVPAAGCRPSTIETTIFIRFRQLETRVCASPVLVKGSFPALDSPVAAICINDALVDHEQFADLLVGSIVAIRGADYVVVTGEPCAFDCVDGFDINCDGKLGDYCPTEFDRRTVAGAKACVMADPGHFAD